MLPADHRLTRPASFRRAVKAGRRSRGRTLMTSLLVDPEAVAVATSPVRVGFVVSKAVGPAVVRNRVKRRLRHAARASLPLLPDGSLLVVRAHPAAAAASYDDLVADLDRCLHQSLGETAGVGQAER